MPQSPQDPSLPTPEQLCLAVELYLKHAYEGAPAPERVHHMLPPPDVTPAEWLMGECAERNPEKTPLAEVKAICLRLGNTFYPNMKLRMSRAPKDAVFLLSVDSHDAVLQAPEGTPDHAMLEELKAHNKKLAAAIEADWNAAGLPTERNWLRMKIQQAKEARGQE